MKECVLSARFSRNSPVIFQEAVRPILGGQIIPSTPSPTWQLKLTYNHFTFCHLKVQNTDTQTQRPKQCPFSFLSADQQKKYNKHNLISDPQSEFHRCALPGESCKIKTFQIIWKDTYF